MSKTASASLSACDKFGAGQPKPESASFRGAGTILRFAHITGRAGGPKINWPESCNESTRIEKAYSTR